MRRAIFSIGLLCGLLLLASSANAQPVATPSSHLAFDQAAPDIATASGYTYKVYADGGATGTAAASVVCVAGATTGVQTCTIPFPAFTPGAHTLQLTASDAAGESAKSASFAFTLVAIPVAPANTRIVP